MAAARCGEQDAGECAGMKQPRRRAREVGGPVARDQGGRDDQLAREAVDAESADVFVPGDLYPHQFVSRAPLDRVSNDLFHPPPAVSFGFHFPRVGFVVHLGIEISFAFEPLSKIFLSFFEQVRVNRAFLINRY